MVLLFCVALLLLLGGWGMILHAMQADNRQYAEGQTDLDDLLEELQKQPEQAILEWEEENITAEPPASTLPSPILATDQPTDADRQDTAEAAPSVPLLPKETTIPAENTFPLQFPEQKTAASQRDNSTGTEPTNQSLPNNHLIGSNTGVDLTASQAKNRDFVAWLKIPGTNVNYPVVLSDDTDYYLTHSFTGKQSKMGTLFSLKKTDYQTPGRNIAIYGHHITNTSSGELMFRPLLSYKKQAFYEKHSFIYLDSLYHSAAYKVFAVVNLVKGEWDPSTAGFASDADFLAFIRHAQARSLYDTGVEVTAADRILTLITCDRGYAAADGRLIVLAVEQ